MRHGDLPLDTQMDSKVGQTDGRTYDNVSPARYPLSLLFLLPIDLSTPIPCLRQSLFLPSLCHPNLGNRRWSMHVIVHLETQSCIEYVCTTLPIIPTPTPTRTIQHTSNYSPTHKQTTIALVPIRLSRRKTIKNNDRHQLAHDDWRLMTDDRSRWPRREETGKKMYSKHHTCCTLSPCFFSHKSKSQLSSLKVPCSWYIGTHYENKSTTPFCVDGHQLMLNRRCMCIQLVCEKHNKFWSSPLKKTHAHPYRSLSPSILTASLPGNDHPRLHPPFLTFARGWEDG